MASPNSGLSSPSASSEPTQHDSSILTPSRKVKALLAQFDDSDSDQNSPVKNTKQDPNDVGAIESGRNVVAIQTASAPAPELEAQRSDDEVLSRGPRGPRGRLAARMQAAAADDDSDLSNGDSGIHAYARIKDQITQMSKPKAPAAESIDNGDSGDELQRAVLRRRLLQRKDVLVRDRRSRQGTRSPSPLFFPSPSATRPPGKSPQDHDSQLASDSDELPEDPLKQSGSKFLALVEKHRKQRLAREAVDEAKRAERLEQLKNAGSRGSSNAIVTALGGLSDESDMSDGDVGKRLTQQARPTRKASKKALEEMNRETQRMSRSRQLAHQARTKKKITKDSLLTRFKFIIPGTDGGQPVETGHASTTPSSAPVSDVEGLKEHNTPPTSPLPFEGDKQQVVDAQTSAEATIALVTIEDAELPAIEDLLTSQPTTLDKGKAKAIAVDDSTEAAEQPVKIVERPKVRPVRVRWSRQDAVIARGADSDSDLEIVTSKSKSKKFAAFESLPEKRYRETNSHLLLRALAHLQTGAADDKKASMNAAQMEAHLRRAARLQARKEREEKLGELRSKGIFIQTAEDRQKELQEVEDLVELARVEGAEIQRREREVAKKHGTFVKDGLDDDESDDEEDADFQGEDEEIEDQVSGSEEEIDEASEIDQEDDPEGEVDMEVDHAAGQEAADVTDQEAEDAQSEDGSQHPVSGDEEDDNAEKENQSPQLPARRRRVLVLSDEDDEEDEGNDDAEQRSSPHSAKTPQSVLRSARKVIPGLQMSDDLPIGLTQAFAATMAESDTEDEGIAVQEQDSLALTHDLPSPHFNAVPSLDRLESLDVVTDSQPTTQTQPLDIDLSITQTQAILQSPAGMSSTQLSFLPTQDVGYVMSPFKESRFDTPRGAPHSTIDTIILHQEESPILPRKGRLRRGRATVDSDDEAAEGEGRMAGLGLDKSAFAVMQRAATKVDQKSHFDKSKSHAKEVVDEAAEESEDEYAGLGGASDDEEGEENEADQRIIDHDETLGQGDESKLAGFYADKERKQDEVAVSKLLKDITTGALRRKRGAADDIDLSDEEDANARRREAKRREFARMRRELLKDEAVGKIAEDKKKQAFLKSIEDRDEVEDEDVASDNEDITEEDTQSQTKPAEEITTQTQSPTADHAARRKRPLEPSAADITNRPRPALCRNAQKASGAPIHRKPSTLAEIREHVSFLIDEPDSQNGGTLNPDSSDNDEFREPAAYVDLDRHLREADDENDDANDGLADFIVDDEENLSFKKPHLPHSRAPANERRTKANVVDRLTLLRQSSTSSSPSSSCSSSTADGGTHPTGSKLAFFSSNSRSSFPTPPTLLRRATTNSSNSSFTSTSKSGAIVSATGVTVTERGAVENEKEMVRKGQGGKRSAINFYAKGRVEEREKVREGRVRKRDTGKNKGGRRGNKGKGEGGFLGGLLGGASWE